MIDSKPTGRTRYVKKYWLFGPIICQIEYSYIEYFDVGCGLRGETIITYWINNGYN